jgi:hypothetical protein
LWYVSADAGFLYTEDAMLRGVIKETFCSCGIMAHYRGHTVYDMHCLCLLITDMMGLKAM